MFKDFPHNTTNTKIKSGPKSIQKEKTKSTLSIQKQSNSIQAFCKKRIQSLAICKTSLCALHCIGLIFKIPDNHCPNLFFFRIPFGFFLWIYSPFWGGEPHIPTKLPNLQMGINKLAIAGFRLQWCYNKGF